MISGNIYGHDGIRQNGYMTMMGWGWSDGWRERNDEAWQGWHGGMGSYSYYMTTTHRQRVTEMIMSMHECMQGVNTVVFEREVMAMSMDSVCERLCM
jgi:hypothetical protein